MNDIIYMINFIAFVSYIVSINDNNSIIKTVFLVILFILNYYIKLLYWSIYIIIFLLIYYLI